jgi:hypothetical protein
MAIKLKYRGVQYTADTPDEAAKLMSLLREQDAALVKERAIKKAFKVAGIRTGNVFEELAEMVKNPWTPGIFMDYIERLGPRQRTALAFLVDRRQVTDAELRAELDVSNNQKLAGILSGISKQAAAINIPARTIFRFQNLRTSEGRRNTYSIAENFLETALEMSWPYHAKESSQNA